MKKEIIAKLHSEFEQIVQVNTDTGAECLLEIFNLCLVIYVGKILKRLLKDQKPPELILDFERKTIFVISRKWFN